MRTQIRMIGMLTAGCLFGGSRLLAADVGTAFTYQGRLVKGGTSVSDTCTFTFRLYDAAAGGTLKGTQGPSAIAIADGLFTRNLDFGASAIDGTARWLEITVQCPGDASPTTLTPRQELKPAPHALALPGLYTQQNLTSPNLIGGLHENSVTPNVVGATIAGGGVTGSDINRVTDNFGTVGGGCTNRAGDSAGSVSDHAWATVGGGLSNTAGGSFSTVGGGSANTAGGELSTIPGGYANFAGGSFSFAGGVQARVRNAAMVGGGDTDGDEATFVWSDTTEVVFDSTGPNQFLIKASGGVGIGTASPAAQLDVNGAARTTTLEITGGSPLVPSAVGWGNNVNGESDAPFDTVTISAGENYSLAIRSDGTLVAWGSDSIVPSGTFTAVSAGARFSLAIRSDGTLVGWGYNALGQTNVPAGTFTAVAGGSSYHSIAIRSDGTLAGWGDNSNGEIDVPPGTFVAVAAGGGYSLAIRSDGTLAGWGSNQSGEADVPSGTFIALAARNDHSLAIRSDGTLAGWGNNANGQNDVPSGTFISVAVGSSHSVAIRSDGTLVGWGANYYGQTDVPTGTFAAVAAGQEHNLAIRNDAPAPDPALRLHTDSAMKPGSNTWTIFSDRRLKKNIEPLSGALERLLQLRGVTFQWLDPASQGGITGTQMGLIADEVQRAFPQWVGRDPKGYQTLTVGGFEALTAEALRELRAEKDRQLNDKDCEISDLKSQSADFEKKNLELEARLTRIERLETRLAKIEAMLQNQGTSNDGESK